MYVNKISPLLITEGGGGSPSKNYYMMMDQLNQTPGGTQSEGVAYEQAQSSSGLSQNFLLTGE